MIQSLFVRRAASVAVFVLGVLTFSESLHWRDRAFPGFFVMPNRVIPSAGLSSWPGVADGQPVYQQVLLGIDGTAVRSADDAYANVAARAVGSTVRYDLGAGGQRESRAIPVQRLTHADHGAVFGTYFLNGLAYLLLAIVAAEQWDRGALYQGFAAFGWIAAVFAFTAIDLYLGGRLFRLHVLAETALIAGAAHLALVYPQDRLSGRPRARFGLYGGMLAIAVVYEQCLFDPRAYTVIHNVVQGLASVPVLGLAVALTLHDGSAAPHEAPGVRSALIGALAGIVVPGLILAFSSLSGGTMSVTATAWTGFVFPLSTLPVVWPRAQRGWRAAVTST